MNEEKQKKRSFKGITLVEIIVSIAVVSIMTLLLVATATSINAYIKSANNVNKKTALQAPVAESTYTGSATRIDPNVHITVNNNIKLKAELYAVNDPATTPDDDGVGGNLNMKFVDKIDKDE